VCEPLYFNLRKPLAIASPSKEYLDFRMFS